VALLGEDERVEELAAMLAGTPTTAARQSARELLDRAVEVKAKGGTRVPPNVN
jgi:DNA repair ATPase RecN